MLNAWLFVIDYQLIEGITQDRCSSRSRDRINRLSVAFVIPQKPLVSARHAGLDPASSSVKWRKSTIFRDRNDKRVAYAILTIATQSGKPESRKIR